MKLRASRLEGRIIKDNHVYKIEDNTYMNNLTLSKTILHTGQNTLGHTHEEVDEVYIFLSGKGEMSLDDTFMEVNEGDIVLIPEGNFHQVFNPPGSEDLVFLSIFESYIRPD